MNPTQQSSKELLDDFLEYLNPIYKELGVFSGKKDTKEAIREIMNRFYSNLVSLQNHLLTKDSLSSTLVQRYNNELVVDFYYLIDPSGEENKIENFFNHDFSQREWSKIKDAKAEKRKFIPPWVISQEGYKNFYKRLSNLAHPNILSLQLNRKGNEYEFIVIKDAICLCVFEISLCLNDLRFRELFPNIDWANLYFRTLEFQNRASALLLRK